MESFNAANSSWAIFSLRRVPSVVFPDVNIERPSDANPCLAFLFSQSTWSGLKMNFVPVMSGGLAALYAAVTSAPFLSSLSVSRPNAPPKDATDLLPASHSDSFAEVSASSLVAERGLVPLGAFFFPSSKVVSGRCEVLSEDAAVIVFHFSPRSHTSLSTIAAESLAFEEDVVPFLGFQRTSLYTLRPCPENHLLASGPWICSNSGMRLVRKRLATSSLPTTVGTMYLEVLFQDWSTL